MSTITNFPAAGTFDWMTDLASANVVESAYKAVSLAEGWEFLKTYEPEAGKGFVWSTHPPKLEEINAKIHELYNGHSGGSYGWTMRQIEDIAKNGWEAWVTRVRSWPPPRETTNYSQPTEEEMVETLRRLRERGLKLREEFEQRQAAEADARATLAGERYD